MNIARHIATSIVDFVLPIRCAGCGDIVSAQGGFCVACWQQLNFLAPPWCKDCGLPLPFESEESQSCAACLADPPRHDGIRAAVAYSAISRDIALKLKYGGKIGTAKLIAQQLSRHLPQNLGENSAEQGREYLIAPVPLHWTRLWARSFNQSALIAQELSRLGGIEYMPDMLIRTKRTDYLRGKSGKERRREVSGAFALSRPGRSRVENADILLVDDVYTSGATSDACVKLLKASGARSVRIYCWARVLREENGGIGQKDGDKAVGDSSGDGKGAAANLA